MINTLPIKILAQINDVTVLQTAASVAEAAVAGDSSHSNRDASYGEFNLGLHVHDHAASVLDNRMRLLAALNQYVHEREHAPKSSTPTPINRLHWVNQVHGNQVYDVDDTCLSMQPKDADAMVAREAGQGLAIMTADCVPIVLYQPSTGQIAAIHAGWQGLACGVIQAAVARFTASLDTAQPIMAWMGACISQACYEIDAATSAKIMAGCLENHLLAPHYIEHFAAHYTQAALGNKVFFDLPKLAAHQLLSAGVTLKSSLPVPCSYSDTRYYSYRRQTHLQQPATGRMALIIARVL